MLASIVLDQKYSHFTNLDIISGKVYVRTESPTNVSNIQVKLEGESRTRLVPPPTLDGDRQKPRLEFHKILYQIQMVFPPQNVKTIPGDKTVYTIPPGQHEYPFSFKVCFSSVPPDGNILIERIVPLQQQLQSSEKRDSNNQSLRRLKCRGCQAATTTCQEDSPTNSDRLPRRSGDQVLCQSDSKQTQFVQGERESSYPVQLQPHRTSAPSRVSHAMLRSTEIRVHESEFCRTASKSKSEGSFWQKDCR